MIKKFILLLLTCSFVGGCGSQQTQVKSPHGHLKVNFSLDAAGKPIYSVYLKKRQLLKDSQLGLVRNDEDFSKQLEVIKVSQVKTVRDKYVMQCGKRRLCEHQANQRIVTLRNGNGKVMDIIFQVSDDGVAFRYGFPGKSPDKVSITEEKTTFAFPEASKAWLHPLHNAKSGWCRTYPSYESHYVADKEVGTPAPFEAGWSFPALFKIGDVGWVLLTETDTNGGYCATHLARKCDAGVYRIGFPQLQDSRQSDPVSPQIALPFKSPWRIIIAGDSLKPIVQSTLATDLATPSTLQDTSFVKPGRAAWSWLRYGDDSSVLSRQRQFLEMAAKMGWEYILVDCNWDRLNGYEKIAEFVKEAAHKKIGILLWYNTNGSWNDAPMTPKNRIHTSEVRRREFERISKMGVRGIKADFFGGDKQFMMQLYQDIMSDAADYKLLVNFHGATVPRGWQRTWPNLMTTEAVMGEEYVSFTQYNADKQPEHCCILPFTRNAVASMDYTPVVFDKKVRGSDRVTTLGFELALSVIFESGIQHFGLAPYEVSLVPDFVIEFLKEVPAAWDDTVFVEGYPGQAVVLARRAANSWYIAGINGQKQEKTIALDLSFIGSSFSGYLITDDEKSDGFTYKQLKLAPSKAYKLTLKPYGGFVIKAH